MFDDTPLIMIDSRQALEEVARSLADEPVIGVDTESDSFHHYREKLCLIQLSDRSRDIIIDPLGLDNLDPLRDVFADPDRVKVLHGADYDVVCLKRDFDLPLHNIFDTMITAQFLGFDRIGLADLIKRYFGHTIDKKYQRHDWARRPLLEEHLEYARGDTHWLLALREVLTHRLEREGRLEHVLEECRRIEDREWTGRERDDADFLRIKGAKSLDDAGRRVLRGLYDWRDGRAAKLDRPSFKVLSNRTMLDLARRRPQDAEQLHAIVRASSTFARRHGDRVLKIIADAAEDKRPMPAAEPQLEDREARRTQSRGGPGLDRLLGPLKAWRNTVVEERGLNPVVVASNGDLREIARMAPSTLEELAAVPGIRDWQVRDFGEEILALVAEVAEPSGRRKGRRRRRR